jgi:hypothetical protein
VCRCRYSTMLIAFASTLYYYESHAIFCKAFSFGDFGLGFLALGWRFTTGVKLHWALHCALHWSALVYPGGGHIKIALFCLSITTGPVLLLAYTYRELISGLCLTEREYRLVKWILVRTRAYELFSVFANMLRASSILSDSSRCEFCGNGDSVCIQLCSSKHRRIFTSSSFQSIFAIE